MPGRGDGIELGRKVRLWVGTICNEVSSALESSHLHRMLELAVKDRRSSEFYEVVKT